MWRGTTRCREVLLGVEEVLLGVEEVLLGVERYY